MYRKGNIYKYKLAIPNKEVKMAFIEYLGRNFFIPGADNLVPKNQLSSSIYDALYDKNPEFLEFA